MCAGCGWKCVLVGECLNDFLGGPIFVCGGGGDDTASGCCW